MYCDVKSTFTPSCWSNNGTYGWISKELCTVRPSQFWLLVSNSKKCTVDSAYWLPSGGYNLFFFRLIFILQWFIHATTVKHTLSIEEQQILAISPIYALWQLICLRVKPEFSLGKWARIGPTYGWLFCLII